MSYHVLCCFVCIICNTTPFLHVVGYSFLDDVVVLASPSSRQTKSKAIVVLKCVINLLKGYMTLHNIT